MRGGCNYLFIYEYIYLCVYIKYICKYYYRKQGSIAQAEPNVCVEPIVYINFRTIKKSTAEVL